MPNVLRLIVLLTIFGSSITGWASHLRIKNNEAECKISIDEIVSRDWGAEKIEGHFWVCRRFARLGELTLQRLLEMTDAELCFDGTQSELIETLNTWIDFTKESDVYGNFLVKEKGQHWKLEFDDSGKYLEVKKDCNKF